MAEAQSSWAVRQGVRQGVYTESQRIFWGTGLDRWVGRQANELKIPAHHKHLDSGDMNLESAN